MGSACETPTIFMSDVVSVAKVQGIIIAPVIGAEVKKYVSRKYGNKNKPGLLLTGLNDASIKVSPGCLYQKKSTINSSFQKKANLKAKDKTIDTGNNCKKKYINRKIWLQAGLKLCTRTL